MKGNEGANQFADVLVGFVQRHAPDREWLDLGVIQADLSLKADRFKIAFPVGRYYLLHQLQAPDPLAITSATVVGDHGSHTHAVPRPAEYAPLAAGDRVLIAWVNDSTDPVVVGRVRTS